MQITIPKDAEAIARGNAAAEGFSDVSEYVVFLINKTASDKQSKRSVEEALTDLHALRAEVSKMTTDEIVALVGEARADLQ